MKHQALILREAARAAATVREFEKLGIESFSAQLIETVWPQDLRELRRSIQWLVAGEYQWLVLTSVNTVEVIATILDGDQLPRGLKVASVGTKTAAVAKQRLGVDSDFVPTDQSAAGMVEQWHLDPGQKIFYPHGDLASSTLAAGLAGHRLDEVVAYQTVGAPSGAVPLRTREVPAAAQVLAPQEIAANLGRFDLVVFSAPSIVRRFVELTGDLPVKGMKNIAIGQPTAQALRQAGLPADAIASEPTPTGLAIAAQELIKK
ncbi:uroporphyrinogen-III synthase [Arthrobacter sp. MYb213]|uniref:uroporphyrinogen-III synthase n=1 Tax=Arthrobacter sp. MYb213 TaxID=1848595 RepID=UPI000CFB9B6A|nr:uroporphyrinogen-III synthase [Arthrobacter sp. MYb213]PRB71206.1 hypothetical protein CQ011_04655 [Arthrobacter sp. MYb213]